jgi:N-acetylglucosaminyldiphosphoundecaprenol N-acetyl-beta-D-mannosaminyltransferase
MVAVTQTLVKQSGRFRAGPIGIDSVSEAEVIQRLEDLARSGQPHQVVTANLRFVTLARRDESFARIVNSSTLVVPDGMPLIWASKIAGDSLPARITGSKILHWSAKLAAREGYSFFLLGTKPGVADEAAQRLQELYPGLKIAGTQHGYFRAEDEPHVVQRIREARPQFLFVAMGCPKQEQWIAENLAALQVPVCVGIGGTLEIVTGRLKGAPGWVQRIGLEWFYRMAQEPGRLWKRYLVEDMPTGIGLGFSAVGRRLGRK